MCFKFAVFTKKTHFSRVRVRMRGVIQKNSTKISQNVIKIIIVIIFRVETFWGSIFIYY